MFSIDRYAYSNRLSSAHPGEKLAFALLTMLICLAAFSPLAPLAAFFLMSSLVVGYAGVPWRFYLKLLAPPLAFLALGGATIALSISLGPASGSSLANSPASYGITLGGLTVGVTSQGLAMATRVVTRSLGALASLYFLSLTTPMTEIVAVFRKSGAPALLVELLTIVYRFIFVLMETAHGIYTAQSSRNGYASLRTSFVSLGQLVANLFIKSLRRSQLA
ncbi:MAG: cobalt ECF transporter T component CbiQ, partial [Firmicutes bacterium]|nr:cobalt ECF transporter T component CbiQ [Bacillota bacterium]